MTDSLSIVVQTFACRMLILFSADETPLPKKVKLSTKFQRTAISCGDVTSLIKADELCFVCIEIDIYVTF